MRKNSAREIRERVSMAVAQAVKLVGPVNQTNAPVRKIARQLFGIAQRSQPRQLAVLSCRGEQ